ncbi:MAG: T9SS C-terminal target domain-containing protein [Alphaproteobacteria bacterium]|nr:MAG: T9SS C-terminal target domain-containing protein [Alphaproteobacteria bacterium]
MELLVAKLKTARPNLDIRLHNISKAVLMTHANTNVGNIPLTTLFEDLAPHGRSTWYCLAAIAEYIELFNEKPSATFTFNPTWNVDPIVTNNYQQIVDYMWTVLRGNTVTSIQTEKDNEMFTVFPNPVQNQLYIITSETDFDIEITNLLGQSVLKSKNNTQLDVSQLAKGTYLLNYKGKSILTKKIIITD